MLGASALLLLLAACGGDDDAAKPNRDGVVEIIMKDSRYEPTKVDVNAGDDVTFRFTNDGELRHEAFIGSETEQDAHEDEMRSDESDMEDMAHGADRADMVTIEPGESAELTYTFDRSGTLLIGCHEPGHYRGGMKATVNVS
jgi:uncharacterized cupredoxin-like copper-binding protein